MPIQKLVVISIILFFLHTATACKTVAVKNQAHDGAANGDRSATQTTVLEAPTMNPRKCVREDRSHGWHHLVYRIEQDGMDVGREVRTTFPSSGPMGEEEITISHMVTRHKSHDVEIDRFTVQTERFLKETETFLRGCYVVMDESNVHLSLVGYNGAEWERVDERLDSVESSIRTHPSPLPLKGDELVGHKLNRWLSDIALSGNTEKNVKSRHWYVPKMKAPVPLDFSAIRNDRIQTENGTIDGAWISAMRAGSERVVLNAFVGKDGKSYIEEYPSLHQKRSLTNQKFSVPSEYTDPYRGLFSNAYLGFPDAATKAIYHIVSTQPISMSDFAFIAEPTNQKIKQRDSNTLILTVEAGGPDGDNPPDSADLSSTKYINTKNKMIKDALVYLKSGGKKGRLPTHRCDNAVPIIAKSARIRKPAKFWADADKTANLIAEYVHAILPVKRHTHTMNNAVDTLKNGLGDCTEHSVLFAALMRAAKVPTRLVSGMYLSHGGSWVFHMWNEYWNGDRWHSIDVAVGPKMKPGANYVALSLGAATFDDHRHNISFFLDRSYSGLNVNLMAANSNGEALHLARPRRKAPMGTDAVIVQALTLSKRGDFQNAFNIVNRNYNPEISPIDLELLRADLLQKVNRMDEAISEVKRLRGKTSLPANVFMLDKLEFDVYLAQKNRAEAQRLLDRLADNVGENSTFYIQLKADVLAMEGKIGDALTTIDNALLADEYDTNLMSAYVRIVAENIDRISEDLQTKATDRAWYALYLTHYASADILKDAASLFYHLGESHKALPIIEHALIMKPNDVSLRKWHESVGTNCGN